MIEILQSILALIVTIAILVTVHEFGHFYVAKRCGVMVERFSVGFGRPLLTFRGAPQSPVVAKQVSSGAGGQGDNGGTLPGTEYVIAMIPLGGYVKMLDERDGQVPPHLSPFAFNRKFLIARVAIVAAGPVANFLLAFGLYWILFTAGVSGVAPFLSAPSEGTPAQQAGLGAGAEVLSVDERSTPTWRAVSLALFDRLGETGSIVLTVRDAPGEIERQVGLPIKNFLIGEDEPDPAGALGLMLERPPIPPVLGEVVPGGRANAAGIAKGDRVLKVSGQSIETWQAFVERIQAAPERALELEVDRAGQRQFLTVRPEAASVGDATIGRIGVGLGDVSWPSERQRVVREPIYWAWIPALNKTVEMIGFTLDSIGKMVQGLISTSNLSGPITIAKIANRTAQTSLESFVTFIALVSISLGVLNLLPIPMLDGGHLLYFLVEGVTGRPVSERIQMWGLQIGMVFLVGIMMLAFYNDLLRL